jgi:hypothetical protein
MVSTKKKLSQMPGLWQRVREEQDKLLDDDGPSLMS